MVGGLIDWLACAFTLGEYRKCGHLHIDITITGLGLSMTIGAAYAWRLWWKEQAQRTRLENAAKPHPPPESSERP